MKIPTKKIAIAVAMTGVTSASLAAAIEYRDALDLAVAPLEQTTGVERTDHFILSVGDSLTYDNNLYLLPRSITDLSTLPGIGSSPDRKDYIDRVNGGMDAEWLLGARQSFDVDLDADYNRYFRNQNLNYVGSNDRVAWNWGLGDALSGKIGVDYLRLLGGFANTDVFSRDIVNRTDYFGSLRYQLGPRWGIFAGLIGTEYTVSGADATFNNSTSKGVDAGADFTFDVNRIAFDYRYNDSRAGNAAVLNGVVFDPDFREDRARVLVRYALSEKTIVDASAGYLKREYPSTAIGSFQGEIWRVALQWQPTPKTQLLLGVWQQLSADLTSQTDYFRDRGVSLTPQWVASSKLTFSASISHDDDNYIGSNPVGVIPVATLTQARHDKLTGETASMTYTPIRAIMLSVSASHTTRDSNISQFHYNDVQGTVGITYKFFRYGSEL
ncbi:MAG TPA: outer membrane beta-barrel protein [Steroidobacteraceae bacterium]|nr:outer membrane beta-barrel protein [Steroidobacteraceae bacterium]